MKYDKRRTQRRGKRRKWNRNVMKAINVEMKVYITNERKRVTSNKLAAGK